MKHQQISAGMYSIEAEQQVLGAVLAVNDRYHEVAVASLKRLDDRLVTTWPVLTETCHLLLTRLGPNSQVRFMQSFVAGAFGVFSLEGADARQLSELMQKYANLPMDLADASLVLLAERLGHGRILSTDQRDFQSYRWKQRKPFENLLLVG